MTGTITAPLRLNLSQFSPEAQRAARDMAGLRSATDRTRGSTIALAQSQGQIAIALRQNAAQLQRVQALYDRDPTDASRARVERLTGALLQQRQALRQQESAFQGVQRGGTGANQVLLDFGRLTNDSIQFSQGLTQGLVATANQIDGLVIGYQRMQQQAAAAGTSIGTQLVGSLKGPGGLILLLNIAATAAVLFGDDLLAAFTKTETGARAAKAEVADVVSSLFELQLQTDVIALTNRDAAQAALQLAEADLTQAEAAEKAAQSALVAASSGGALAAQLLRQTSILQRLSPEYQEIAAETDQYRQEVENLTAALDRQARAQERSENLRDNNPGTFRTAEELAAIERITEGQRQLRERARREEQSDTSRAQRRAETAARQAGNRRRREQQRLAEEQARLARRVPDAIAASRAEIDGLGAAVGVGLLTPLEAAAAKASALESVARRVLDIQGGQTSKEFEALAEDAQAARAEVEALLKAERARREGDALIGRVFSGLADEAQDIVRRNEAAAEREQMRLDAAQGTAVSYQRQGDEQERVNRLLVLAAEYQSEIRGLVEGTASILADGAFDILSLIGGDGGRDSLRLAELDAEEQLENLQESFRAGEISAERLELQSAEIRDRLREIQAAAPTVGNVLRRVFQGVAEEIARTILQAIALKAVLAGLNILTGGSASGFLGFSGSFFGAAGVAGRAPVTSTVPVVASSLAARTVPPRGASAPPLAVGLRETGQRLGPNGSLLIEVEPVVAYQAAQAGGQQIAASGQAVT
ncbi:MAG: hypothetical protein AAF791_02880 [Bacteroidota bacterium]